MTAEDLAFLSLAELATLIEARKASPVELVDAHLARIETLDGVLRAFITVDAERARAAAKAAEDEIAAGSYRGPLHGVTVAHKDIIDVRGMPTTAASKITAGYIAKEDATVTARLRAAGAICLGKLNLIEFASGSMGLYGYARNPHNLAASPGGSSSGSGTALAAGLVTIATGTDTGGSVRNPAGFCGLAGLRPTYGRVSRYGCMPLSWSQDSIGPMARSVADVALMLGAMAGPDSRDSTAAQQPVPDYAAEMQRGMRGLRIGVPEAFYMQDLDLEIETAIRQAITVMRELGAEVREVELPSSPYASSASWTIAYSESFVHHEAWFRERSRDYTPAFYHKITAAGLTSAAERIIAQRVRQLVTRQYAQVMRDVDVILTPASRTLASSRPGGAAGAARTLRWAGDMTSLTRPVSLCGYPALVLPAGFANDHTPIGMQLVGRPWEESTLFRAGQAYERVTGWHRRRPAPWPAEIPPAAGATPAPAPPAQDSAVSPEWVMEMARLLDYGFVTEEDAAAIAPMLGPVKEQLRAAQRDLKLDLEPPTRAAGWF